MSVRDGVQAGELLMVWRVKTSVRDGVQEGEPLKTWLTPSKRMVAAAAKRTFFDMACPLFRGK